MSHRKKPWRKILYEKQDYPDNYTPPSFLEDLKKNINLRKVTYKEAFLGASLVNRELCVVILFIFSFIILSNDWYSAETVFYVSSSLTLVGYIVYIYLKAPSIRHFYNLISYLVLAWLLAPVLQTLTATVSTDTVYAMTVFLMSIHLIFADYGVKVLIVSSSLSINATTFGSLCLASRLPTPFHVFVLLNTAVESFILCPQLFNSIEDKSASMTILFALLIICTYGLYNISVSMMVWFLCAVVFINVICPYLFVSWFNYKENIYGPWDEAVISPTKLKPSNKS